MLNEPPIIDHNPHEHRPSKWFWWGIAAMVVFLWIGYLSYNDPDWWALAIGGGTAALIVHWSYDLNGGIQTPPSWRGQTRRK